MNVFQQIPQEAPVIVAEAVWASTAITFSRVVSPSRPILTVAKLDGRCQVWLECDLMGV